MTTKEYIDEIKLRLNRTEVQLQMDDPQILTYINMARRQIQRLTMGLFPERYGQKVTINLITGSTLEVDWAMASNYINMPANVWSASLPTDFITPVLVILHWVNTVSGVTYRSEARQMTKTEMFNIQQSAWDSPNIWDPVYTIDRDMILSQGGDVYKIYISGLELGNTTLQTLFDISTTVNLEVWYVGAIMNLDWLDTELTIPPDFEELVIYYAMTYCLLNMNDNQAIVLVEAERDNLEKMLQQNYELDKLKKVVFIPSKEE